MSSNFSLLPYKYNVTYNSTTTIIPAFPGAYIYNSGIDSTAVAIPIYFSNPSLQYSYPFMHDKDYVLVVLPGFKVDIYADVNFVTLKYSVDNIAGTDLMFYANKTGSYTMSSYRLYYSFSIGIQELSMASKAVLFNPGTATTSYATSSTNESYILFSYTTVGESNFVYNDTTPIMAEILVVGGGGGGGAGYMTAGGGVQHISTGGGGGAGEVVWATYNMYSGTYKLTVGDGGQNGHLKSITSGSTNDQTQGQNGTLSKFMHASNTTHFIEAGYGYVGNASAGGAPSSGGTTYVGTKNSVYFTNVVGINQRPSYRGGYGAYTTPNGAAGGGGEGAGSDGSDAPGGTNLNGSNGGNGVAWPINNVMYGGGGGSGKVKTTQSDTGTDGVQGTGTYGGGGKSSNVSQWYHNASTRGKANSGIVIIGFKVSDIFKQ